MKRRGYALALAFVLALTLWGCAAREQEKSGPVLWFAGDTDDWDDTAKAVDAVPYEGDELSVDGLMTALLAGPAPDSSLLSPFPAGTRLLGWQMDQDGLLWVDLSDSYGSLAGIDLTLADYCIALTLEQLAGVERVSVTVSGRQISYRYRQELSGGQVIFSGAEETPVEVSAELYFPRTTGRGLGFEVRTFQLTEDDVPAQVVAQALIGGPEGNGLSPIVPEGTELRSVRLEDGVCWVNFSEALLTGMPDSEDRQSLVVYAIVNTLGNLKSVESVRIQVEGEALDHYGAVALPGPLEPDFGLGGSD